MVNGPDSYRASGPYFKFVKEWGKMNFGKIYGDLLGIIR